MNIEILMNELVEFSLDTENAEKNYNLAQWYESNGHTAPAHSYYLRAAERATDKLLSYHALLRASFCYRAQGYRDATEKVLLENALMLLPERPEAYYFLSMLYERKQEWQNVYIYANLGLQHEGVEPIVPEYSGTHLLIYQKAVAAWWWGKGQESRELFSDLMNNYWNDLDSIYQASVVDNLSRLGITSESQSQILYTKEKHNQLRYKFKDSELIDHNYSQVFQDIFVLSMLNGKRNGTFFEIGGAKPFERNNTALLEQKFGWVGVSVEFNDIFVKEYKEHRPNIKVIHQDALTIDYKKILQENFNSDVIDYLQLDIEPAKNTYECMLKIPFDEYKFAVITYGHDYYLDQTKSYCQKSREFLKNKGYVLVVNDISPEGKSTFEDWWVHPDLIDDYLIKIMTDVSENIKKVDDYMLPSKYYAEYETDKYVRENFFPYYSYNGVMVEVGAGPPSFISNSKHFRDSGWRTICVEPNPKFVEQHKKEGSEVYQYACSNEEGKSSFTINYNNDEWYSTENDGVSFSALEIRHDGLPEHNTQEIIEVETIKLDTLLEKIDVKKIDILSIDVEGWELDVMRGFNPHKFNTKVVILENIGNKKEYEEYMSSQNFSLITTLGCNQIYKSNESSMKTTKNDSKNKILEIYNLYDSRYGTIWGFCSDNKAGCLIDYVDDLCNRLENPVCVEIGVYGGKSILPVALELKRHNKGIIYAIDSWNNTEAKKEYEDEHYNFWKNIDLERYYNIFIDSLHEFELNNYVSVLKTTSDNAPEFDTVDLLYIDGQHTEQALKDAKKYATKIPPGGYCLVDDVNWGSVSLVPDYLLENGFELIHGVDVCKIFKKRQIVEVNATSNSHILDEIDWGIFNDNLTSLHDKEYIKSEIKHNVYTKFFDVEKDDVVFDIGASVGPFTISILDKCPKEVHCFEPHKELFKSLYKNLNSYENVHLNCLAIDNQNSQKTILNSVFTFSQGEEEKKVDIITFKDYIKKYNIEEINFLKTDCEGGEWSIFTPENYSWIRKNVRKISGEFHLHNLEMKNSFIQFRDLYLKNAKNVVAFISDRYALVEKIDIWDDNFIFENLLYCNISFEFPEIEVFLINEHSKSTSWIVDNFYKTPDKIRDFALQQEYVEGGFGRGFIGRRTEQQFLFPGLKERFEEIMGRRITEWESHGMNGRFQIAWSGEPLVYHCDSQQWGGMLYLTPDAPYECGTTLYAHKKTRARTYYDEGWDASWKDIPGDCHLDGTPFEPVDVLGNVYNRLVIFDASAIHSASEYFGTVKENARLWQMFFFDTD